MKMDEKLSASTPPNALLETPGPLPPDLRHRLALHALAMVRMLPLANPGSAAVLEGSTKNE